MTSLEVPQAGFFRLRLVRGAPAAGIEIRYGPPLDPETGEEMDRSWRWQAFCNGRYVDFDRVWPRCVGEPIGEKEYRYYTDAQAWALDYDAFDAMAAPTKAVDWSTATPPSF